MQGKITRRKLAQHVAAASDPELALREVAAYLIASRRTREADLVARTIEDELAARGVVTAHVTSAHPLSDELKTQITELIGARQIHIVEKLDPGVLGGVRVETPGKLLDATIKRKLLALRQAKI